MSDKRTCPCGQEYDDKYEGEPWADPTHDVIACRDWWIARAMGRA